MASVSWGLCVSVVHPFYPNSGEFIPLVLPRVGGILFLRLDDVATRYNYVTKIKLNKGFISIQR